MKLDLLKTILRQILKFGIWFYSRTFTKKGYKVESTDVILEKHLTRISLHFDSSSECPPIESKLWQTLKYGGRYHLIWSTQKEWGTKEHRDEYMAALEEFTEFPNII